MRFLLYLLSFILLDAIVPRSCRNESAQQQWEIDDFDEAEENSMEADSLTEEMNNTLDLNLATPNE